MKARRHIALLALGLVALPACTSKSASDLPRVAAVPFVRLDPGPLPDWLTAPRYVNTTAPAGTAACRDSTLGLRAEPMPEAAGFRYRLTVTTTQPQVCAIGGGRLAVDILDAGGRLLVRGQPSAKTSTRLPLERGGRLSEFVRWRSSCGLPGRVRVRLRVLSQPPASVVSTAVGTPRCLAQGTTGTNPQPFLAVVYEPPMEEPKPWHALRVDLDERSLRSVGSVLHFQVVLRNPTRAPVALRPCPVYSTGIGESATGTNVRYRLNCEGAGNEIAAGAAVRFDLELPLDPGDFGLATSDRVRVLPDPHPAGEGFTMGFTLEGQRSRTAGQSFPVKVVAAQSPG